MPAAVEVAGVTKRFGAVTALSDLDLRVGMGEVHGLLGPNGAGKSTLLRVLFGLVAPDAGTVALFGRDLREGTPEALAGVAGFVDRPHFYPYLTARRTLELLGAVDGGTPEGAVDRVLAEVGLADVAHRRVGRWSTGMVQRLGIAAALLRRPQLLLVDEPTEGLDPGGARDVLALMRRLAADGVTVLLSSHDMAEVDTVCDSATILSRGRVASRGSLAELRRAAPLGRHHLVTSDDDAARGMAARHGVHVFAHAQRGLAVEAGPAEMHEFICDLGRHDVSVVVLEQELSPLTALFFELTAA
ncbi:MAG TPA: ABC transporter ATP-binding protein [Acidimicrobiales bacterium]|nr:ABC transporter ATP-binding protein [Acidimicrobiales bacterium]